MKLKEKKVVTSFLRNRGEVLLLRRSEKVGSYQGRWGAVSGHLEDTPEHTALQEIAEETGLEDAVSLVRKGVPFSVEDENLSTRWVIFPFLFDCAHRDLRLDWETTEAAWVSPTRILYYDTVPQLWKSYAQVAPSLEGIQADRTHGSAYLSYRALEVLRDRAGCLYRNGKNTKSHWNTLRQLAQSLVEVRPSMTAIANRVNRAMHASSGIQSAQNLECVAHDMLTRAHEADREAARQAATYVTGRRVFTLSRSGTLLDTLRNADPPPLIIVVAESRPGGEGIEVAEQFATTGYQVSLIPDSRIAQTFQQREVDVALVGADAVLSSGSFINKIGTLAAALAARYYDVPFYVVTAIDKCTNQDDVRLEVVEPSKGSSADEEVSTMCPLFEKIPPDLVTGFVTERGMLLPEKMDTLVKELERISVW